MYKKIMNIFDPYRGMPREVYIIFASRIVNALGCFVMPLLTIILTERIGLSKQVAGLYISIAGILYMPASMIGGKLADTIGRKKIIIIFETLSAMLYIVCGFMEPTMNMILVLLFAVICMVMTGPAHDSLIADLTTPKNRSNAYALCYMGWNIGFAVGPMLGGLLYKNHLPLVFIGDAVTALLSLSLIFFFIGETLHLSKEEITDSKRRLEKREEGSIFSVLLKRPILIYFSLILLGYNFAYSQWSFMMPMHAMQNFTDGAKYYGFMGGLNGAVVMIFTPFITKLVEKEKELKKMIYGGILYAVGFGMLGIVDTLMAFYISVFIFTLGEIVLSISVTPFIVNHTPASHRGRMSATLPVIFGMGHTFGPLGMGKLLMHVNIKTGWLIIGGMVLLATMFMALLKRTEDEKEIEESKIGGEKVHPIIE